jgi:hypothetical protein
VGRSQHFYADGGFTRFALEALEDVAEPTCASCGRESAGVMARFSSGGFGMVETHHLNHTVREVLGLCGRCAYRHRLTRLMKHVAGGATSCPAAAASIVGSQKLSVEDVSSTTSHAAWRLAIAVLSTRPVNAALPLSPRCAVALRTSRSCNTPEIVGWAPVNLLRRLRATRTRTSAARWLSLGGWSDCDSRTRRSRCSVGFDGGQRATRSDRVRLGRPPASI